MTVIINGTTGITTDTGYSGDGVTFADGTPSNTLVTTTSGNVGIGTSSPSSRLAVESSSDLKIRFKTTGTGTTAGIDIMGNNATVDSNNVILYQGGSNECYLYNRANSEIRFGTNNTERMRIDSSGRVTMPYQPCFSAAGNQSVAQGSGQVAPFNVATLNIGSHYSTSTYRFTAPIAGVYFFSLYGIIGGNVSGQGIVHIRKNGSVVASMHRNSTTSIAWEEGACMLHISLAANDYVDTYIGDGNLYLDNGNYYSGFSGRLVG